MGLSQRSRRIASVSWHDHLEFGRGTARLATPDDIATGVKRWRERDGAHTIYWRDGRYVRDYCVALRRSGARSRGRLAALRDLAMDERAEIVRRGHEAGMAVYLYVTIFDEGWPPEAGWPWHPDESWQSRFTLEHPELLARDHTGLRRHWGILSYGEPEARAYRVKVIRELVDDYAFDGVFVCTRSQSPPAAHGDEFGFNSAAVEGFRERHGVDVRREPFDLDAWRTFLGEGLTSLMDELRTMLRTRKLRLSVGIPRGDFIGPPVGNVHLDWRAWLDRGLLDELVIGQIAEVCPSTWIHLWPERSLAGYLLDPVRGAGLRPLSQDLDEIFGPACAAAGAKLYLSRLHDHADAPTEERILDAHPSLGGLLYSTFRCDDPSVVEQRGWLRVLRLPSGRTAWDPERGLITPRIVA